MSWYLVTVLLAGIGTIAIFTFLVRENALYRFFEHVFIGIAAGLGVIFALKNFLWPNVLVPLLGLDIVTYPDGTRSAQYDARNLLHLLPILFGALYYFIYSRRHSWLAKLVIGFSLGAGGGLAFEGFFNEMMPQVISSFKPLVVFAASGNIDYYTSISNLIFVFTLLAVMYYFFFSFRGDSAGLRGVSLCGRWLMMVCFGAFFGSTVMARMALLVERLQFIYGEWWSAVKTVLFG